MNLSDRLGGCVPAISTPLNDQEELDISAMRSLVNRLVVAGVHGLFVAGTAGEGPMLEDKVRYKAIEIALDESNGRVPIIAGTGDTNTASVKRHNREAARLGASAAMILPPFYFSQSQQAIHDFFCDLIQENDLPIMLYNFPQLSKIYMEPDSIKKLIGEGLAGVKDSSGNFIKYQVVLQMQSDNFIAYQGMGGLILPSLLLGAKGWISPVPNVAPDTELKLYAAVKEGNIDQAKKLQAMIIKMIALWAYGGPPSTVQKAILQFQGIGEYYPARPNPRLKEDELNDLEAKIKEFGLIS